MLTLTNLIGFGAGAGGVQSALVTTGLTHIGATITTGSADALDDGNENQSHTEGATVGNGVLWWHGWDLTTAKNITGCRAVASNNRSFKENATGTLTFKIFGKASSPASDTDGTEIGTISGTDANSAVFENLAFAGQSFRYVWMTMQTSDTGTSQVAELIFYETV